LSLGLVLVLGLEYIGVKYRQQAPGGD
jgi:hypothetical protein